MSSVKTYQQFVEGQVEALPPPPFDLHHDGTMENMTDEIFESILTLISNGMSAQYAAAYFGYEESACRPKNRQRAIRYAQACYLLKCITKLNKEATSKEMMKMLSVKDREYVERKDINITGDEVAEKAMKAAESLLNPVQDG